MKRLMVIAAVLSLTACAKQVMLIAQDGPRYTMEINKFSKSLSTNIDGVLYAGKYVMDEAIGMGTSHTFGMQPITTTSTMVVQGSNVQAVLTSATGDYIECEIKTRKFAAVGKCQSNKGRQFALTSE